LSTTSTHHLEEAGRVKQAVPERVWALLERERVARFPGAKGRIPNFAGALVAAALLASRSPWRAADVVKADPDAPQLPVRARAWPRASCCTWPCPAWSTNAPSSCSTRRGWRSRPASISGSTRAGRRIGLAEMQPVDLVVCGSVPSTARGPRVGKGGGFSDLEFALLVGAGLVGPDTVVATTVHPLQVLEEALPEIAHNVRLDLIVTRGLPPHPTAGGDPLGPPRRGQGRRHPRPSRPSTTSHTQIKP
jgi:5-formyltetrahydrofolate cyclo-ligase